MKFFKDIIFNIIAQLLFILVQQIVLFPKFETYLGTDQFGQFIVYYGILNVVAIALGTSFTNLYEKTYNLQNESTIEENYYNLFKYLIIYYLFLSIPLVLILDVLKGNYLANFILVLLIGLIAIRVFLLVKFRVKREFKKILFFNVILSILYLCLYFVKLNSLLDILIAFTIIETVANILILLSTKFSFASTLTAKKDIFTFKSINTLLLSGAAGSLMNYADRFVISFFLGLSPVTIFYIATLPTKLFIFPFNMVSSVVLSYLARSNKINNVLKKKVLISLPIILSGVLIGSYYLGKIVIWIIYPKYLESINNIYLLVNLTFMLVCLDFILRSFLLKYISTSKKAVIDISTLIFFLVFSSIFICLKSNLFSLVLAQFVTYLLKGVIQLIIFYNLETGPNTNEE